MAPNDTARTVLAPSRSPTPQDCTGGVVRLYWSEYHLLLSRECLSHDTAYFRISSRTFESMLWRGSNIRVEIIGRYPDHTQRSLVSPSSLSAIFYCPDVTAKEIRVMRYFESGDVDFWTEVEQKTWGYPGASLSELPSDDFSSWPSWLKLEKY